MNSSSKILGIVLPLLLLLNRRYTIRSLVIGIESSDQYIYVNRSKRENESTPKWYGRSLCFFLLTKVILFYTKCA